MTETQRRVLQQMADGDPIMTVTGGRNSSAFWRSNPAAHGPRHPTIYALIKLGFIEASKEDWRGATYNITQAGRRALAEKAAP